MDFYVDFISNILLCAAALIGFIYSLIKFFKPKQALYKKMVGCALGCMFIERLYGLVQYLITAEVSQFFQVGSFGTIGCYMFLFSANYGAIDSLVDDGSPELKKYRRIAFAAPLAAAAAAILILLSFSLPGRTIICAIEELFVGAASYFSLKHLIIPKQYSDILSGLRPFHAVCLLMAFGTTIENIIWCYQVLNQIVWMIPYVILMVSMLALAPVLERGTKWKI